MLAAKRRVEVGREEIFSVSFWNSASKGKFSGSWLGKRMIKTFGKSSDNSASGFAVILIPFSVR